ncbi:PREDICTED: doublecortin domain-containing protein 2-like [Cyprinodon variegatus]|uniref:Doublecortin domain-containing protein 2 n=1 Tax=Cyprinodon variegatus TaxID=28743 RepID=A0A3Q2EFM5_CYPVA|nr:PREDICTED: doublecortin domain-containing protein 2-like [Cyprinodon variegatus]
MGTEKPNFLSQPVVKNIFMFRNGDPYYEARRIVINEKRVGNFETLLREVTGGIQAPFGAVRNIYTPRGGHKVEGLDSLQSGEQYVAAGKEKFKKIDYLDIGTRKKRMMQTLPAQARPHNRIIVSARFLKPIKEPCTIFVVANGDVLNPAMRLLIHQRIMGQFDRILEMITEKMGLRVLGGVRSLYTYEGQQVTDGNKLECGQLYVAVGRERFKKLPYSDLLFSRPKGTRRIRGMKAQCLPPIYRFSKQNGNNKSTGRSSDNGDADSKASPSNHCSNSREHLASAVREISQARLLTLRKKKSGQSITAGSPDSDDAGQADRENTEAKTSQDQGANENSVGEMTSLEDSEKTKENPCSETDMSTCKDEKEEVQSTTAVKEEEEKEAVQNDENTEEKAADVQKGEKVEENKASDEQNAEILDEKPPDEKNGEKVDDKPTDVQNGEKVDEKATSEQNEEVDEKATDEQNGEKVDEKPTDEKNGEKVDDKLTDEQNGEKVNDKATSEQNEEVDEKATYEQNGEKVDEKKASNETNDDKESECSTVNEEKVEGNKKAKEEVSEESKNEVNSEEQGSTSSAAGDMTQDNKEQKEGLTTSSEAEKEQDTNIDEDKQEKAGGNGEESTNDHSNDADTGEGQKEAENRNIPGETQSDKREGSGITSSSRDSNQEDNLIKAKDEAPNKPGKEEKINEVVNVDNEKVEIQAKQETNSSASFEDETKRREKEEDAAKDK